MGSTARRIIAFSLILAGADLIETHRADATSDVCDAGTVAALQNSREPVPVGCSLTLSAAAVIRAPILLSGSQASGSIIDCRGGVINPGATDEVALTIASVRRKDRQWDAPRRIVIRNCILEGAIRVIGMGVNGEAEPVRQSSLSPGHTERAQAAAPSDILLTDLKVTTKSAIPLYAGPGTTKLTVSRSTFSGMSGSVGVYLDAESAENTIEDNHFDLTTKSREIIALDGSARNTITENTFKNPVHGGVFLYRNCGEGGTIRHQAPQYNTITRNVFHYRDQSLISWWTAKPALWLGSRQGNRSYCFHDAARPFGSSLNARDEAQHNVVSDNWIDGGSPSLIVDDDTDNQITGNR